MAYGNNIPKDILFQGTLGSSYSNIPALSGGDVYTNSIMDPLGANAGYVPSFGSASDSIYSSVFANNTLGGVDMNADIFSSLVSCPLMMIDYSKFFNPGSYKASSHKRVPLSDECKRQIAEMAKDPRINCDPKYIENLIYSESGGDPHARNAQSGAVGLIQWVPKYHPEVAAKVANLSAEQQMPYVKEYLINAKKSAGFASGEKLSAGQLYALVFMPAKAKQEVMCSAGTLEYAWNKGLDANGDGIVTSTELGNRIS